MSSLNFRRATWEESPPQEPGVAPLPALQVLCPICALKAAFSSSLPLSLELICCYPPQLPPVVSGKCVALHIHLLPQQNMSLDSSAAWPKMTFPLRFLLPSDICCHLCFLQSHLVLFLLFTWRHCLHLLSVHQGVELSAHLDPMHFVHLRSRVHAVYVCSASAPPTCSCRLHPRIA